MRKPAFCIYAKTKTQISCAVTAQLISAFVFATRIVQSLYFLNPKFQAPSHLQWLYSTVCVGPGRKPRRPVFSQRGSILLSAENSALEELNLSWNHLRQQGAIGLARGLEVKGLLNNCPIMQYTLDIIQIPHNHTEPRSEKTGLQGFRPPPLNHTVTNSKIWVHRNIHFCSLFLLKIECRCSLSPYQWGDSN